MTLHFEAKHRLGKFVLDAAFTSDRGVTALFGRSGSGKTSIIRIIAGLIRPDQGKVVVDGDVLVDTQEGIFVPKHKRRFATVFQEGRLFPHLTVQQNLNYGRWFAPKTERSDNLSKIVDLLGIGSILDRRPEKLSGGEKQRVAIGRACCRRRVSCSWTSRSLRSMMPGRWRSFPISKRCATKSTYRSFMSAIRFTEVARLADRVIVMSEGKVAMAGTPQRTF